MIKCLYNGKIILNEQIHLGKALLFTTKIIAMVNEEDALNQDYEYINADGNYIAPGFIDIHIHGYHYADVMDGTADALITISKGIAANGVTSFLPTTMSMAEENIIKALEQIKKLMTIPLEGAQILGAHLEGPYINPAYKGAQNDEYIICPTSHSLNLIEGYQDTIKLVTLAPEIEGAQNFIKYLSQTTSITLSMGHTNATYEEAIQSIAHGISHATHLFNAMSGLHHRHPGTVGAALTSPQVDCELIADNVHVDPALFSLLVTAKSLEHLILITDCMSAGGCPPGQYSLGGQDVFVNQSTACLKDGTLAGSILSLNQALKNFIAATHIPIEKAIKLVTLNPAKSIRIEHLKGSLNIGKDADIVIFNKQLEILHTICRGCLVN